MYTSIISLAVTAALSLSPALALPQISTSAPKSITEARYLSCEGSLPASGYPTDKLNLYRTNFTDLTDFCSKASCGCLGPSNGDAYVNGTLHCPPKEDFSKAPDTYAMIDSAAYAICNTNCSCPRLPPLSSDSGYVQRCPKGAFPEGKGPSDYITSNLGRTNISCYDQPTPLYTIVDKNFNASDAQICDPCPGGYGPDRNCKQQPMPLPGPCCLPGQSCYWPSSRTATT